MGTYTRLCGALLLGTTAVMTAYAQGQEAAPTAPAPQAAAPAAPTAGAAQIDEQALALLQRVDAIRRVPVDSLSAEFTYTTTVSNDSKRILKGTIRLLNPAYLRVDQTMEVINENGQKALSQQTVASDGTTIWSVDTTSNKYTKRPATGAVREIVMPAADLAFSLFVGPTYARSPLLTDRVETARREGRLDTLKLVGTEVWNGKTCQVVSMEGAAPIPAGAKAPTSGPMAHSRSGTTFYIGPDNIVYRQISWFTTSLGKITSEYTLSNLKTKVAQTPTSFAYALPAGATLDEPPRLLVAGTPAPDFTVTGRDGKPIHLADLKGKVVVLDFWATWCGPCQASLPHTQSVASATRDQGVVVLAVNVWDNQTAYNNWFPTHKQYSALQFAIDPRPQGKDVANAQYNVTGIPTQYVIDRDGKVAASILGFDASDHSLEEALTKLGVHLPDAKPVSAASLKTP